MLRHIAWVGFAALTLGTAMEARAAGDKAAAEALFDQGKKLMSAGNASAACPKFEESFRSAPGLGTMLWLADCYEVTGRTASAWGEFREAAAFAAERGDPREKIARKRAAALEPKLSKLVIVVPKDRAVSGLEVRRDGVVVKDAAWGTEVPVDPGTHTIVAAAPNKKPWENTVRVAIGAGTTTVTVNALADAEKPPPPPETAATAPTADTTADAAPTAQPRASGATQRTIGLVAAGAGVVGIGLGAYFGIRAKSQLDDSNAGHCNGAGVCDSAGLQGRVDALNSATLSTIAFIAGGALVAGGAILYFTAPSARKTGSVSIAPSFAASGAGLVARGAF
jgi:hypothetical protein